jgi:hypothetical protein
MSSIAEIVPDISLNDKEFIEGVNNLIVDTKANPNNNIYGYIPYYVALTVLKFYIEATNLNSSEYLNALFATMPFAD